MRLGSMDVDSGEKNSRHVRVSLRRAHCGTKADMMTPTSQEVAPHMAPLLDMLDAAFRRYGVPERSRNSVAATPRHMFVHRFRLGGGTRRHRIDDGSSRDNDPNPVGETG